MTVPAPQTPVVLAFDTSGPYCAAAVLIGEEIVAARVDPMARGQAERLMGLLDEVLAEAGRTWHDLTAIGVGIGPGNFTGIRISVAAARGLAMGLDVPAIGVSGFEARRACHPDGATVAIPAPRDQIYVADPEPRLTGAGTCPGAMTDTPPLDQVGAIARIAAARMDEVRHPPAPLYVRPADAAPPRDAPPVMLD